jgi:hypothetical protein
VREGSERILDDRFCVVVNDRSAMVMRLRLDADGVGTAVEEIRALVSGADRVTWWVGSSATPPDLADRLRELGLGAPKPPVDPVSAAMVLTREPPPVPGVEVRLAGPQLRWLAFLDGRQAATAKAIAGPAGLLLIGGSTEPWARGRGCYRALVRARWEEAVRRGTPALVVQAGPLSEPILRRLGFERVATIEALE